MKYSELARKALAHLSDQEYQALKVPAYRDPRVLAAAAFLIAHTKNWVDTSYLKQQGPDEWVATSYYMNFKKDQGNDFALREGARFNWVARGLLPVDYYYRYAGKDTNMGWVNLNRVFRLCVLDGYTGKTIRTFLPGLVPEDKYRKDGVLEGIRRQEEESGIKVSLVDQNEVIRQATKGSRRYADMRR